MLRLHYLPLAAAATFQHGTRAAGGRAATIKLRWRSDGRNKWTWLATWAGTMRRGDARQFEFANCAEQGTPSACEARAFVAPIQTMQPHCLHNRHAINLVRGQVRAYVSRYLHMHVMFVRAFMFFYYSHLRRLFLRFFVDAARCLPPRTRLSRINNANARQDCM